jgi:hypothetical protein
VKQLVTSGANKNKMHFIFKNRASAILYDYLCQSENSVFILPANVCSIVPVTFLKAKVSFLLADINLETFSMDLDAAECLIKNNKANSILYVYPYGATVAKDIEKLKYLKLKYPFLNIIADKCLCIPDFLTDFPGMDEDLILYSTGYSKVVDIGIGGFGYSKNAIVSKTFQAQYSPEDLKILTDALHGAIKNKQAFNYANTNWLDVRESILSKDEFILRVTEELKTSLNRKYEYNEIYKSAIPEQYRLPDEYQYWRFNILVQDNENILNDLFSQKLFASAHYVSLGKCFGQGSFPNAEYLSSHIINLFNDFRVNRDMVCKVAQSIYKHLG